MNENENVVENQEEISQVQENNATVIKTDVDAKDGQNKCPKCGATDISLNPKNGKLRCNFCRHEFEPEKLECNGKRHKQTRRRNSRVRCYKYNSRYK